MYEINEDRAMKDIRRILENPFWLDGLSPDESYKRQHDDTDGTNQGNICITFSKDGDGFLLVDPPHNGGFLRFRTFFGGGQSSRTLQALLILALAIKLDNEERPQHNPTE